MTIARKQSHENNRRIIIIIEFFSHLKMCCYQAFKILWSFDDVFDLCIIMYVWKYPIVPKIRRTYRKRIIKKIKNKDFVHKQTNRR